MSKSNILLSLLVGMGFSAVAATCTRLDNGLIRLQNNVIQADVNAVAGARCVSLIDRRTGLNYTSASWDMGIGGECDWQERKMTQSVWFGKHYAVTGIQSGETATLQCSRTGTGDKGQWITITKTYALPEDSTELTISYDIAVQAEAMKSFPFCLWLHNSAQLATEPVQLRFLKEDGIHAIPFTPNAPVGESFHYDMADSWIAVARKNHPSGLVLQTPYQDMMCLYNWQGAEGSTIEQMFRSQTIPCGSSFKTSLTLTAYDGIAQVDGAGAGLVAQLLPQGLRLYAAIDGKATVQASLDGKPEFPVTATSVELSHGKTSDITIPWPADNKGKAQIVRISTPRGTLLVRNANGCTDYRFSPVAKRLGNDAERYGMVLQSEEASRDCYDWHQELPPVNGHELLRRDAYRPIRLLAITDMMSGREVCEIASRMNAQLETCTFSSGGALGWHPVWGHSGGLPETNLYLEKLLKKDYDAILFGGQQYSSVSTENMDAILEKVKAGTAFISVMPTQIPQKYEELFPVKPLKDRFWGHNPITKAGTIAMAPDSPMIGFPLKSLSFTPLFPYAKQPDAFLTCANGQPLFAVGICGKGRTAAFTWLTGRDDNTTRCGIMPFLPNEPELPWHNVYYAMIIRAVQLAANRMPNLAIESFSASPDTLDVTIRNPRRQPVRASLDLNIWCSSSEQEHRSFTMTLAPGTNNLTLKPAFRYTAPLSLVEVILSADGFSGDFAYDTVNNAFNADVSLKLPEAILPAGQPAVFTAQFQGDYDRAEAVIKDRFQRILAQGTFSGNEVTLTPQSVVEHRAELTVTLFKDTLPVATRTGIIDLVPETELERNWDNYKTLLSWPVRDNRVMPYHLRPVWHETLRDLGIDLVMSHGIPVGIWADNRAKYMLNYRYGGPLVMESITRLENNGIKGLPYPCFDYRSRKKEVDDILEKYGKTGDKTVIRRNPRLDDPVYLEAYQTALGNWLPTLLRWRPYMCDLGDEMSYGIHTSAIDFDFSPEGLSQFRNWLKQRYNGNLDLLNHEWERSYTSWEQVIPDTGAEAKARGIFAPWGLHRLYSTVLFADFWRMVSATTKNYDQGIRISASGTPNEHPYNGYDYEQLMPTVDTLLAYTRGGLAEVIASFKKAPLMSWVGYGSSTATLWHSIWDNAFNGHFGVGFYSEMVMINPDLTLTKHGEDARDAVQPLKDGLGQLLYHCDSTPHAFICYSIPSMLVSGITDTYSAFRTAQTSWVELLKKRRCNPRFITPSQIVDGKLLASGVKLLVLPMTTALSDAEIDALRQFTASGGTILADIAPGQYNENLAKTSVERMKELPVTVIGGQLVEDLEAPFMQRVGQLLDSIIPLQKSSLEIINGQPEVHPCTLCHEGGELIGLWTTGKTTVRLSPPQGHQAYDAYYHKPVTGTLELLPNRPAVYVILPYKVTGLKAEGRKNGHSLELSVQLSTDGAAPLRHGFIFRVRNRNGEELPYHKRVVNAPGGKASVTIPLAINETASHWMVTVTDIISGKRITLDF